MCHEYIYASGSLAILWRTGKRELLNLVIDLTLHSDPQKLEIPMCRVKNWDFPANPAWTCGFTIPEVRNRIGTEGGLDFP